jgi:TPR repeat protein
MDMKNLCNAAIIGGAFTFSGFAWCEDGAPDGEACMAKEYNEMQENNYKQAANLIRRYAKVGDPNAQFALGTLYRSGLGVRKNERAAVRWFEKAAQQGLADAQYNLGIMYANGNGVTEDQYIALDWIFRAAQQGHKDAEYTFNIMINSDFAVGC